MLIFRQYFEKRNVCGENPIRDTINKTDYFSGMGIVGNDTMGAIP